mmetsp:Transcript_9744/g.12804  ORF Transcript_9744/g.12804 Transcript_9744/m.12804 type:complete len:125 (-) Transcript_9744:248-622(-)
MRLITHNMLCSNVKGVQNGFPLRIEADNIEIIESEFDSEFISMMLEKIDYEVLAAAAVSLEYNELPPIADVNENMKQDEQFQRKVHHALLDIHLQDGRLVCPESGRPYPVKDGIPNMLLHEDEV